MTPVTQILILLKIFFSPFFIVNILTASLHFLYVTVVWKSNSVTQFGDENKDKKRRIKVRRWTLKIILFIKYLQYIKGHQPTIWP